MATDTKAPPHNSEAEVSTLGACLRSRDAIEAAQRLLTPEDFYIIGNAHVFTAILALHRNCDKVDAITVSTFMENAGTLPSAGGRGGIAGFMADLGSTAHIDSYAQIILRAADARRLQAAAMRASKAIYDGADPYAISEELITHCTGMERAGAIPSGYTTYSELLDNEEADAPVIIPGLAYADSRVVVVAEEKAGKSVLIRQIAFCASQGVHPFKPDEMIEPVRVLLWDLENPTRELRKTGHLLRYRLQKHVDYDDSMLRIFRRPAGIDITSRHDRGELEAVMDDFKPQLVVGGPVYKMVPNGKYENAVTEAGVIQDQLDFLRIRYGCALILEAHAPIGNKKDGRPLRTMGGQRWQAWPDVSISLKKSTDGRRSLIVDHQHDDRGSFDWPKSFERGKTWPWESVYPTGTFNREEEEG